MNNLTRRILLSGTATAAILATAVNPVDAAVFRTGAPPTSSSPASLTTLAVSNPGPGALASNSYIQFGHAYGATDLPSGKVLQITDDLETAVPYTAMRRSTAGGSSVRFSDNVARLPNGIAAPLVVTSITRSGTTATATTSGAHGLTSGTYVHMEGQLPDDFCGLYAVTVTGSNTFTYVMPTTPASNATTAGQMNYCRILTLTAVNGSWNNTLPAGKTSANILADVLANFDNQTLTLSSVTNAAGSAVASGTFTADLATAVAATGTDGQLRTTTSGQGALVCDFVAIMKFNDSVTPTTHLGAMSAWFYVTAFLHPTTGAVVEVRSRVWIDQSLLSIAQNYYTYQATLKLGSTVIRSTGLSSTAAIDGKLQTFAPSDVNTTTAIINLPGHKFQGGETIRLTTTGVLPSGYNTSDKAVIYVDGNNIKLGGFWSEGNMVGNSSATAPVTQGSGTHTITCWLHTALNNRLPYCRDDGLQDRWTGKTGTADTQLTYVIHNNTYLQQAKAVPAVDLTVNLTTKAAIITTSGISAPAYYSSKDRFVFGGFGTLQYGQDVGGAGAFHEYGGPWSDKPLRKLRYANDRGYAQTLRVDAMMIGTLSFSAISEDTTWRPPVANNGPDRAGSSYAGLPAPTPLKCWLPYPFNQIGYVAPTSTKLQNGIGRGYSYSHRYIVVPRLYFFEGGQDIHDLMVVEANSTLLGSFYGTVTWPTTKQMSAKKFLLGGVTYYVAFNGSEPRADAWTLMYLADALFHTDDTAPEKPYLTDQLGDMLKVMAYMVNVAGPTLDPGFNMVGGWGLSETGKGGVGYAVSTNYETMTTFMQAYQGITWGHCYRMLSGSYASSDFTDVMRQHFTLVDNLYRVSASNGAYGNSYDLRVKRSPGTVSSPDAALHIAALTDPMILDLDMDCIVFRADGLVVGCNNASYTPIYPADGDVHEVTDSNHDSIGYFDGAPPELADYNYYTVRAASGSYLGWKYQTSGGTPINSYSPVSSNTLVASIDATQTVFETTGALTCLNNSGTGQNKLVFVGNELMELTPKAIASLTWSGGTVTVTTTVPHGLTGTVPITISGSISPSGYLGNYTATVAGLSTFTYPLAVNPGGSASSGFYGTQISISGGTVTWGTTLIVARGKYGTTAAVANAGDTIYVPYEAMFWTDVQNRTVAFPPLGHAYRITGSAAAAPDGYLTMNRAWAAYGYLNGFLVKTTFNNADAWFQDPTAPAGTGPGAFAANNTLKDSVMALP